MKPGKILTAFFAVAVLFGGQSFILQDHGDTGRLPNHIMKTTDEIRWQNGPVSLPEGVQYALLQGDWTKEGPFTARLKFPADYKIPPHWHPQIEHITVIKGSFSMGTGEKFDRDKAKKLPVGGFAMMNIGYLHYAFTTESTIIQLHGTGPWGITYVNEEDDPRLAKR